MDESVEQSNLQIRELNLIDVSFEDDSLINFAGPLEPSFSGSFILFTPISSFHK